MSRREDKKEKGKKGGMQKSIKHQSSQGGKNSKVSRGFARPDGNPTPIVQMIEFPYVETVAMDPTSGSAALQLWNLTGLYDPNQTGTGHQPLGFDQWLGLFYNYYCVVEAYWDVIVYSQSATATGQVLIAHGLADDTAVSSDLSTLWENPTFTVTPLGSMGSSHDVVRFHGHLDISKHFGITRAALLAAANHLGDSTAIPAQNVFLQVLVAANNASVNPENVITWTKLRFLAVLSERRELAQS
jgi:hypothetical protein